MADLAATFAEIGSTKGPDYVSRSQTTWAYWAAEIPGKVSARAEALTGPTTPDGQRVQLHNPPGAEVGPGQVATWGRATADRADGFGFKWEWDGRSSKHFPFDWQGPSSSGRATTCPLLLPARSGHLRNRTRWKQGAPSLLDVRWSVPGSNR